jgi:hypothetical protein
MSISNLLTENSLDLFCNSITNTTPEVTTTINVTGPLCKTFAGNCVTNQTLGGTTNILVINFQHNLPASCFVSTQACAVVKHGSNAGNVGLQYLDTDIKYVAGVITTSDVYNEDSFLIPPNGPFPVGTAGILHIPIGTAAVDTITFSMFDSNANDITQWSWECKVIISF